MPMNQPANEISATLVALISRNTGAPEQSIERNVSVWEHFRTHASVTSFVEEVCATFDVFLTEEEWEDPTLEELVQIVHEKCTDPGKSISDWHRERAEMHKGAKVTFGLVNIVLGAMAFFSARGPMSRRVWVTLGLLLFMNAMLLLSYWKEMRQLGPKPD